MKKIYGLFVGIDEYLCGAHLGGCVNDATHMLNYMQKWADSNGYDLKKKLLFSPMPDKMSHFKKLYEFEPATRNNILVWFQKFFLQEGITKDDTLLFFFAGHGSTEVANEYFEESNGLLNTLVCHDSRTKDSNGKAIKDILDKEIRFLVRKVWEKTGAEIVLLQDSCHSAGASRDVEQPTPEQKPRFVANPTSLRSVDDFLVEDGDEAVKQTAQEFREQLSRFIQSAENEKAKSRAVGVPPPSKETVKKSFQEAFPEGEHVHFGACTKLQYAYEGTQQDENGKPLQGGNFTHTMIKVLRECGGKISYDNLAQLVALGVNAKNAKQNPVVSITNKNPNKGLGSFLRGDIVIPNSEKRFPLSFSNGLWFISVGGADGLKIATGFDANQNELPAPNPDSNWMPITVCEQKKTSEKTVKNPDGSSYKEPVFENVYYDAQIIHTLADKSVVKFVGATPANDSTTCTAVLDESYYARTLLSIALQIQNASEKSLFARLATNLTDVNNYTYTESGTTYPLKMELKTGGMTQFVSKIQFTNDPNNCDFTIRNEFDEFVVFEKNSLKGASMAGDSSGIIKSDGLSVKKANFIVNQLLLKFQKEGRTEPYKIYVQPLWTREQIVAEYSKNKQLAHYFRFMDEGKEAGANYFLRVNDAVMEIVQPSFPQKVMGIEVPLSEIVMERQVVTESEQANKLFVTLMKMSNWCTLLLLNNKNTNKDFLLVQDPNTFQYTGETTVKVELSRLIGKTTEMIIDTMSGDTTATEVPKIAPFDVALNGKITLRNKEAVVASLQPGSALQHVINTDDGIIFQFPDPNDPYGGTEPFADFSSLTVFNNNPHDLYIAAFVMNEEFAIDLVVDGEKSIVKANGGYTNLLAGAAANAPGGIGKRFTPSLFAKQHPEQKYLVRVIKVIFAPSQFHHAKHFAQPSPLSELLNVLSIDKHKRQKLQGKSTEQTPTAQDSRPLPQGLPFSQAAWGVFNFRLVFKNPYYKG